MPTKTYLKKWYAENKDRINKKNKIRKTQKEEALFASYIHLLHAGRNPQLNG